MSRSRVKLPLALVLICALAAVVVSACGGGDSTASRTPTPTMVVGQPTGAASATGSPNASRQSSGSATPSSSASSTQPPSSFAYKCPSNADVVSTLQIINDLGPDIGPHDNGIQCIYSASQQFASPIPQVTIYFTPTTADTFARNESGLVSTGLGVHVDGVGDDAFTNPGELNVRKGGTYIQVISPLSIAVADGDQRMESLARIIVASIS